MTKDIKCPYCLEEQDIDHGDGYGYQEDTVYEQECTRCGRTFIYTTTCTFHYKVEKADCLNGAEHTWKPTHTWPRCATQMYCTQCDAHRDPTDEERAKYGIPTNEEEMA